eukprot:GFYU01001808.1.p1 GENE.GFYU01001808.1~~GFYU01001808.1.p1  ORF type:complete len:731 (-),score=242.18 GFYU01001808.1:192-2330(-)
MGVFDYPVARRDDTVVDDFFGTKVADPYRWLENPASTSEETQEWMAAQNKITEGFFDGCDARGPFKDRLTQLLNYNRYTCPVKRGNAYYYSKNDGLQNQYVMYQQKSLDGESTVFLDPNKLSEDGTTSLGSSKFSKSGDLFAYSLSHSGSDWKTLYVKNVETGKDLDDKLEWVKFSSMAWTHDDKGFYYARYPTPESLKDSDDPEKQRGTETDAAKDQKVYYHRVGTPQSEDVLIFEAPPGEEKWLFGVEVSDDGKYLIITIYESCDPVNRFYYADISAGPIPAADSVVKLIDNFDAAYDYITNEGTVFYLKTNLKAPKYKLITIDLSSPAQENWKEIIPEKDDVLEAVTCANNTMLPVIYMHDVKQIFQIYDFEGKLVTDVALPSAGSVGGLAARKEDCELFYSFTSFLYPGTIYRYNFETNTSTVFRESELKGFDPEPYKTEQVFYPSKDGTKIPMFIVSRKDVQMDGTNPVLLYGYGGFSISLTPSFSVTRLLWIQHLGGVLAIPNLRGGGEYGEDWHVAGTKEKKQNVFDDFQCAAEYLISEKYTSAQKICIQGGSNGGLLVGACVNQRPDLYGAAIAQVGVMDMLRFHKFTIGYAWVSDFGSSEDKDGFEYLHKYSPLHNIRPGKKYPSLLLTTASHDDRVVPAHSFKFMAELHHQLRDDPAQTNPLLIRIDTKAGHGAGKPTTKIIEEASDMYGFIAKVLGLSWSG